MLNMRKIRRGNEDKIQMSISMDNNREMTRWRPRYHFTAPGGWINDPNGLCFFRGKYHLFYQYNPCGCDWGQMYWGHAVSEDLTHWDDMPIALFPDRYYDSDEAGGCFSGSAIVENDRMYLFYTGTSRHGNMLVQSQCVAYSEDGIHFTKYEENPVIIYPPALDGEVSNFRDPKVLKYNGRWYMVVGSTTGGLKVGDGRIFLYESEDLLHWDYKGILLCCNGEWTSMCECPDFFQIDGKWVLMFSLMHAINAEKTIYAVGEMDFEKCKFSIERTGELDYGMDYYAPQSFLDDKGRRILIAWQNSWWWLPWFNDYGPTEKENWRGSMSYPRELKMLPDGRLALYPVEELEKVIQKGKIYENMVINITQRDFEVPKSGAYRLKLSGNLRKNTAGILEIGLKAYEDKATVIRVDFWKGMVSLDRRKADAGSKGNTIHEFNRECGDFSLTVLVDRSSVEFFVNEGDACMTCTVFPEKEKQCLWMRTKGGEFACDRVSVEEIIL